MMKRAFTLIELAIAISIMAILVSLAVPIYNNYILKSHFEEAKLMIHKIALAQERYKKETSSYKIDTYSILGNENTISDELGVDLTSSNNFTYSIYYDGSSYRIRAILRYNKDKTCEDGGSTCKQDGTIQRDSWVDIYPLNGNNFYIEFKYPSIFDNNTHFFMDNYNK